VRVALFLCATVVLLGAAAVRADIAARPAIAPSGHDPLVVRGMRFEARERVAVRVIVRGGPARAKSVTATAGGTFRLRFPALTIGACASYVIRATGARGSRAAYTMHPPPCGPAP
jgi:hypothetical protein